MAHPTLDGNEDSKTAKNPQTTTNLDFISTRNPMQTKMRRRMIIHFNTETEILAKTQFLFALILILSLLTTPLIALSDAVIVLRLTPMP